MHARSGSARGYGARASRDAECKNHLMGIGGGKIGYWSSLGLGSFGASAYIGRISQRSSVIASPEEPRSVHTAHKNIAARMVIERVGFKRYRTYIAKWTLWHTLEQGIPHV